MSERELIEKIEQYLSGALQGNDLSEFEAKIQNDAALKAKVKEQLVLTEKLRAYGKRKELKAKLDQFHSELNKETLPKNNQRFLQFSIRKSYLAIAASTVAVLITVSFFLGSNLSVTKKESAEVANMKKDIDNIKKEARIDRMNSTKAKAPIAPANSSGTGFLISSQGYILTCDHLISNADSVFVENDLIGRIKVEKIFNDPKRDLAILKIDETTCKSLGKVPFMMKKKEADLGEKVFTLGFPRDEIVYGEGSVSSASGFNGDTLAYQISIPVNPGNSGGPLLDEQGNLIGIIKAKQTSAEASTFAVKAEYIKEFLNRDKENKISVSQKNSVAYMKRSEQIKKLKPFIFNVRVY